MQCARQGQGTETKGRGLHSQFRVAVDRKEIAGRVEVRESRDVAQLVVDLIVEINTDPITGRNGGRVECNDSPLGQFIVLDQEERGMNNGSGDHGIVGTTG